LSVLVSSFSLHLHFLFTSTSHVYVCTLTYPLSISMKNTDLCNMSCSRRFGWTRYLQIEKEAVFADISISLHQTTRCSILKDGTVRSHPRCNVSSGTLVPLPTESRIMSFSLLAEPYCAMWESRSGPIFDCTLRGGCHLTLFQRKFLVCQK
jgi:hypothetical protein